MISTTRHSMLTLLLPIGEPRAIQRYALAPPPLPTSAFHTIAEDDLVARRAGELEAAYLQTKARAAARNGHWVGVESALRKAERAAANNPWVAEGKADPKQPRS